MRKAKTTKRDQEILDQWVDGFIQERLDNLRDIEADITNFFSGPPPNQESCQRFCMAIMNDAYDIGRDSMASKF